jgi:hypothetical protein
MKIKGLVIDSQFGKVLLFLLMITGEWLGSLLHSLHKLGRRPGYRNVTKVNQVACNFSIFS